MAGILNQRTPIKASNLPEIPKRHSTANPSIETRRKEKHRYKAAPIPNDQKSGNVVGKFMLRGQSLQRKPIHSPDRFSTRSLKQGVHFNKKIEGKSPAKVKEDVKSKGIFANEYSSNVRTKSQLNINKNFTSKEKKIDGPRTQQKRPILSTKNVARIDRQKYKQDKVKKLKPKEKSEDTLESRQNYGSSKVIRKHKYISSYDDFSSYADEGITEYPPVKHSSSDDESKDSTSSSSGREIDVSALVDHSETPLDTDDNSRLSGWKDRSKLPPVCGIHSCEKIDYCDTLSGTSTSASKASSQLQEIFVNKKGKYFNQPEEELRAKRHSKNTSYLSPRQKPNQIHKRKVKLMDMFNPVTHQFEDINEREIVSDVESNDSSYRPPRRNKYQPKYWNSSSEKVDISEREVLLDEIDRYENCPISGRNKYRNREEKDEIVSRYRDPSMERLNSVFHSKEDIVQNIVHRNTCKTTPGTGHQGSHIYNDDFDGTSRQDNARLIVSMPSKNWQRIERTSNTIPSTTLQRNGRSVVAFPGKSRQGYQTTNDAIPETSRQGYQMTNDAISGTSQQRHPCFDGEIPGTSWQYNQRNNDAILGTSWQCDQKNNDPIPNTSWQLSSETYDETPSTSEHYNEITNDTRSGALWKGKGKSTKGKYIESKNQKHAMILHVGECNSQSSKSTCQLWNSDDRIQNAVENVHDSRNMKLINYLDRNIIDAHGHGSPSIKYSSTGKADLQEAVCNPKVLNSKQVSYEHNAKANNLILFNALRHGIVASSGKDIYSNKSEGQVKPFEIGNHREVRMRHPDKTHYVRKYSSQDVDHNNSMYNHIASNPHEQVCASPLVKLDNQKLVSHYMTEKQMCYPNPKVPLSEEEESAKKWGDFYKYLREARGGHYSKPKQDDEFDAMQENSEHLGESITTKVSEAHETRPYGEKIERLRDNQQNKAYQDMYYDTPTAVPRNTYSKNSVGKDQYLKDRLNTTQTSEAKDARNYDERSKPTNKIQQRITNLNDDNNISGLKKVTQDTRHVDIPNVKRASNTQDVKYFDDKTIRINEIQPKQLYLNTPYGVQAPSLTYPEHGDRNTTNWNEVEQNNRHIDRSCQQKQLYLETPNGVQAPSLSYPEHGDRNTTNWNEVEQNNRHIDRSCQQRQLYLDTPNGVQAPSLTYPEHGDRNTTNWNEVEQNNRHIDRSCQQKQLYLDTPNGVQAPSLTYPEHGDRNTTNWNEVEQNNRHIDRSCNMGSPGAHNILRNLSSEKMCMDWLIDISIENERYGERVARKKRYLTNDPSVFKRLNKLRNRTGSHKCLTTFSNLYDGGHFPMYVEYKGQHIRRLVWLYDTAKLNYKLYLPIFFNGLKEWKEPYNFCARQAIHEILPLMSWDDIKSVLHRLIPPIIISIKSKNRKIISSTLLAIQDLSKCGPVDAIVDILQPPLAYTLPILNLFRSDNYTSGEYQFHDESDMVPLKKLVSKTLKLFKAFVDVNPTRRRSPTRIHKPEEEEPDLDEQVNPLETSSRNQFTDRSSSHYRRGH